MHGGVDGASPGDEPARQLTPARAHGLRAFALQFGDLPRRCRHGDTGAAIGAHTDLLVIAIVNKLHPSKTDGARGDHFTGCGIVWICSEIGRQRYFLHTRTSHEIRQNRHNHDNRPLSARTAPKQGAESNAARLLNRPSVDGVASWRHSRPSQFHVSDLGPPLPQNRMTFPRRSSWAIAAPGATRCSVQRGADADHDEQVRRLRRHGRVID